MLPWQTLNLAKSCENHCFLGSTDLGTYLVNFRVFTFHGWSIMDNSDLQVLTLPYNNDLYSVYNKKNIKIIIILVLQIVLTVSIWLKSNRIFILIHLNQIIHWVLSFVLPIKQNDFLVHSSDAPKYDLLNSYNLVVYLHLLLWFITLLIKVYLENVYYRRLRILGYNNHHEKVKKFVNIPSFVLHKSNALLLLSTVLLYNLDWKNLSVGQIVSPVHLAELIVSIVCLLIIINNSILIVHENRFRRFASPPDVFCIDDSSRRLTSDGLNQVTIRYNFFWLLNQNLLILISHFLVHHHFWRIYSRIRPIWFTIWSCKTIVCVNFCTKWPLKLANQKVITID